MEQKVLLILYLEGKKKALFSCEIVNEIEKTLDDLEKKLNDRNLEVIRFGQVCFKRSDFKYWEIKYK